MSKQLPLIASTLYCKPWCVLPEVHIELGQLFRSYRLGQLPMNLHGSGGDASGGITYEVDSETGIALIQLRGVVVKHAMPSLCGPPLIDLGLVDRLMRDIAADAHIKTLVLYLDTPGGCALGLHETSRRIQEVKESGTRVVAYTDYQCCSAGYWLAANADEIVASPSAQVGSIGAYIAAIDDSRAWEMEGLELKLFKSGDLKAMGHPGKEWTKAEEEYLQACLEDWAGDFRAHVVANREGIEASTMQGQSFDAHRSPVGLVDRLCDDLTECLQGEIRRVNGEE